ncbi:protein of unknown function [Methylococcus capsulatus]|uniref:Uncharacterized protein n=1 Tax=Methylococcus capsulatus TaxID=414 RepID=A0AA35XU42_METCP|nr:protein of unknown function [Methylococcus capsulatus]
MGSSDSVRVPSMLVIRHLAYAGWFMPNAQVGTVMRLPVWITWLLISSVTTSTLPFVSSSKAMWRSSAAITGSGTTGNIDTIATGVEIAGSILVAVLAGKGAAAVAAFVGSQARGACAIAAGHRRLRWGASRNAFGVEALTAGPYFSFMPLRRLPMWRKADRWWFIGVFRWAGRHTGTR